MATRGRPKVGEEAARREAVVQAAFTELAANGYEKTTMLGIAKRAGASKETLYAWFGNKEGLFSTLIEHQAEATTVRVKAALESTSNPRTTLTDYAAGLLELLLSEPSISLNRAAMSSADLAAVLLTHGRYTAGAVVERYLTRLAAEDYVTISSPATAFQLLYGLVVQDWQIRVLLGEQPPTQKDLSRHAADAVEQFLTLCSAAR